VVVTFFGRAAELYELNYLDDFCGFVVVSSCLDLSSLIVLSSREVWVDAEDKVCDLVASCLYRIVVPALW
jgi:hypothetical protein